MISSNLSINLAPDLVSRKIYNNKWNNQLLENPLYLCLRNESHCNPPPFHLYLKLIEMAGNFRLCFTDLESTSGKHLESVLHYLEQWYPSRFEGTQHKKDFGISPSKNSFQDRNE